MNPLEPTPSPSRKCLLLDDRFIADAHRVRRIQATGKKSGPLLTPPAFGEWSGISYCTVERDDETGKFHLWYTVSRPSEYVRNTEARKAGKLAEYIEAQPTGIHSHGGFGYACSDDGLTWEMPCVGEGLLSGTNVVYCGNMGVHPAGICQRLFPNDPARKFTAFFGDWYRHSYGGHSYAHSPDGIHWTLDPKSPFIHGESDSNNNIIKNPFGPGYFMYERPWDCAAWGWLKGNYRRRIAIAWSENLYNWTEPRNIIYPDEADPCLFYGMGVFHRDGVLFGQLSDYTENEETMDVQLAFSRDGLRWDRLPARQRLFPRGTESEFDGGMLLPSVRPVEVDGDLRFYYTGTQRLHNDSTAPLRLASGIGCVTFEKGRLIGRRGDVEMGILLTHPFEIDGDHLLIDARTTPVGQLVAELVEPDLIEPGGKKIPGFTKDDCDPFCGDSTQHELTWKGKNIASLKGKRVRLRVGLTMATLWSYEITGVSNDVK